MGLKRLALLKLQEKRRFFKNLHDTIYGGMMDSDDTTSSVLETKIKEHFTLVLPEL